MEQFWAVLVWMADPHFCEGEQLPVERLAHVESCRWCQFMLTGAIHSGDRFWQELQRRQGNRSKQEKIGVAGS